MDKPSIDNPCPMLLSKMAKSGTNFYCSSCKKEIIDLRGKSIEEIKCQLTSDTCGIFDAYQLKRTRDRGFSYKSFFLVLSFLSFLGFNVQPIQAQSTDKKDAVLVDSAKTGIHDPSLFSMDKEAKASKKRIKKSRRKRRLFARRKKRRKGSRVIGTPKF